MAMIQLFFTMANNKVQEMSFYKVNEEVLQQIASITSGDFMKKIRI